MWGIVAVLVLTLESNSTRYFNRPLDASISLALNSTLFTAYGVVAWLPACGIIFSFSMLLVNTLLSSTLSMLSCQLIRLDASNSRSRVDEASSSSRWWGFAMLFFLLLLPSKRLLSFLLPTNTTFLFVVLVLVIALASYPYSLALVVLGIDTLLVLVLWECSCRHSMQEGSQFV